MIDTGELRRHSIPVMGRSDRMVPRTAAIERIHGDAGPIIVVRAAAGSGKSTLLAEWALADPRPCAWLTIETTHSDPVLLVAALTRAVADVHPTWSPSGRVSGADAMRSLARLSRAMDQLSTPVSLVVDDVHRLTDRRAIDVLATLADRFPATGRIAFASRVDVGLPLTRWQLAGRVLVIDRGDLDFDARECRLLLERLGVPDVESAASAIHARTEGWVAGTHLMALAYRQGGERGTDPTPGTATSLAEGYLRSELLEQLDPASRAMLVRTSLVEVVSAPLADALCDEPGAGARLADVTERGLLVTPLDEHRQSFRFHSLLRDMLATELARDPVTDIDVRLRAAAWYESAGMIDDAIEHALGAGDLDGAGRLVLEVARSRVRTGEVASITRWIDAFDEQALRERPDLAALAAYLHALEGDATASAHWAAVMGGRSASASSESDGLGADLVAALLCAQGPATMLTRALRALEAHDLDWRWAPNAIFAAGMAELMLGRGDAAAERFQDMEHLDGIEAAMVVRLIGRAERAMAQLDQRHWSAAQAILDLDRAAVLGDPESGRIAGLTWLVADARLSLHRGDPAATLERLQRVQVGRVRLSWALPWLAVRTLTELARVQLLIGDHQGARVTLGQARDTIAVRPDLGRLIDDLELVSQHALAAPRGDLSWSTLTRAELRLLPFLQTYLTIKEIGERLGVSPNTAKTQALSIYGKLGASTRSEAIEAAVARGLLEDLFAVRD